MFSILCFKISRWAEANLLTRMECTWKTHCAKYPKKKNWKGNCSNHARGSEYGESHQNGLQWGGLLDYWKLKTCGYCIEYSRKDLFGEVQYFLYCAAVGNAVAVIKPISLLDNAFLTQPLDKDYAYHIQRAVVGNR